MSVLRKHASVISCLILLAGLAAFPYLIPENPDASVFRNGTLGFCLLACCFLPVRRALTRADRRTLMASVLFGLLFGCALSLGTELFVYDGLLSGLGSMLRRIAVPVLSAPLFGALFCNLLCTGPERSAAAKRVPYPVFAVLLLACWLPVLLAYYPGMLNYDFHTELAQVDSGVYSNIHPLLHSVLLTAFIRIGDLLHSRETGILLLSLVQMGVFACSLAYALDFLQKHSVPRTAVLCTAVLFALHPVFSVMSVSMTKDTFFASGTAVLSLLVWELIEDPDGFLKRKSHLFLFLLCMVCTALMRNNGIFALLFLLPGAVLCAKGSRLKTLLLSASSAVLSLAVLALLTAAFQPESLPSFQLYSLPAQQLVRAASTDKVTAEEREEIRSWYTDDEGMNVHPHLGDFAKGYLDKERIASNGKDFLALWKRIGSKCRKEYVEAFLMLNVGSWYPDDLSHSTIYPDASWSDKGYLQTQEYNSEGIENRSFLPALRKLIESVCRYNRYQKYPVLSVLFCTAVPFWLVLAACAALLARRRLIFLPSVLGVLGLWAGYLLGPCTLPRYTLPLFCLGPVLLLASLAIPSRKEERS